LQFVNISYPRIDAINWHSSPYSFITFVGSASTRLSSPKSVPTGSRAGMSIWIHPQC